ncbi:MAG: calcium/proton exchanger [Opitutaceae bacterium]
MTIGNLLLLLVPLSLILAYGTTAGPLWVFFTAVGAIIPLANWIRRATEHLAQRAGPAIGGLLNVTFGNVAELVLAIFVLMAGKTEVVKAQITGSIIGNSLLGLGLAILVGSWKREKQSFKPERAGLLSSLLILTVVALLLPAMFDYTERGIFATPDPGPLDERLSLGVSVVLILVYLANLVYTLVTHRDVFAFGEEPRQSSWPVWQSLGVLAGATAVISLEAKLVSDALEATAGQLGLSPFFLGITVLAIVGNVAEYVAAMYFARRNQMGLALSLTVGSTIQVALLVAPVLVLLSYFLGHPMNLVFANPLELIAIASVAFAVNAICRDGETTWFEGVLLIALWVLFGMAFFFVTPGRA